MLDPRLANLEEPLSSEVVYKDSLCLLPGSDATSMRKPRKMELGGCMKRGVRQIGGPKCGGQSHERKLLRGVHERTLETWSWQVV